uniref:NADP-dependent oxidoreductase domain-containing protein n=1 Tax=Acrobeloides nanus TaxID=290746 RepID=A0A914C788_9BILA
MTTPLPKLTLNNGVQFPNLGYGTGLLTDAEQLKKCLAVAIESGYRNIDTAQMYANEHIIGEFLDENIKSGKLKREDVFITTKLAFFYHQPEEAEKSIEESLRKLKTDYIDCFLIHWPSPLKPAPEPGTSFQDYFAKLAKGEVEFDLTPHIETWKVLEKFYKQGVFKAIGISNFNEKQIQDLYEKAEIKPQNLQRGIAVVPKSGNLERIRSNQQVFDFELTNEEMEKFKGIKGEKKIFDLEILKNHPYYPF